MKSLLKYAACFLILIPLAYSCRKYKVPALSTDEITNILGTVAESGGKITDDGSDPVIVRGVCWSTSPFPTTKDNKTEDGDDFGTFSSILTGLNLSTSYYVRAYATNSTGTAYGNQVSFNSGPISFNPVMTYGSVTDIDGNTYKTIRIGNQTWMAENLRTSKFNDGSPIPEVPDSVEWNSSITFTIDTITGDRVYQGKSAFCWYNNNPAFEAEGYGKLYDFFAVKTGNLCPSGWHVPAYSEWVTFGDPFILSYGDIIGSELMEAGSAHWDRPDFPGTNATGFTALPGGFRNSVSLFSIITTRGDFWTADESEGYRGFATYYSIPVSWNYAETPSASLHKLNYGLSVRCIMNN